MTRHELELKIKATLDSLKLTQIYQKEFEEKLGEKGYENYIDILLDELNDYKNLLENNS